MILKVFSNFIVLGIIFLVHLTGQDVLCNPSLGSVEPEVVFGKKFLVLSSFSRHTMALHLLPLSNVRLECSNFVVIKREVSEARFIRFRSSCILGNPEQCDA